MSLYRCRKGGLASNLHALSQAIAKRSYLDFTVVMSVSHGGLGHSCYVEQPRMECPMNTSRGVFSGGGGTFCWEAADDGS